MPTTVTEIAPDVFRLSTFAPDFGIQFVQFLVRDEEPFLMHTGFRRTFAGVREAIASVLDPATLRWIGFSHFESDECGALNDWLSVAPHATAICSIVAARVSVSDFAIRPPRALDDGEQVRLGRRRLRFLQTPHLPHSWDAGLFFEEVDGTLFCSDLFFHPGDPEPLTRGDVVGPARDAILGNLTGPMAKDIAYTPDTDATFARLAALRPRTLAVMHGSSYAGNGGDAVRALGAVVHEAFAPR
jgi:glyoxylase-like metal-dependent hydrolase (beta-lactamase superfamily II)